MNESMNDAKSFFIKHMKYAKNKEKLGFGLSVMQDEKYSILANDIVSKIMDIQEISLEYYK